MWLRKFWTPSCPQECFSQTKTKTYCFSLAAEIAIFLLLVANCRCASLFGSLFGGRLYVSREIDVFTCCRRIHNFFFCSWLNCKTLFGSWQHNFSRLYSLEGYKDRVCGSMYPHIMANTKIVVTYHFLFLQNLILIQQLWNFLSVSAKFRGFHLTFEMFVYSVYISRSFKFSLFL